MFISFNTWTHTSKAWSDRKSPMRITRCGPRGKGWTIIGAIGKPLKNSVLYKFASSTNSLEFLSFVHNMIEAKVDKK